MNNDWLNLLFLGNQLLDYLEDLDSDFDIDSRCFDDWSKSVLAFVQETALDEQQKQVLLSLIEQIGQMAKRRVDDVHNLQEALMKTHLVSRKYLQSS